MHDHHYIDPQGNSTSIAALSTAKIHELLRRGIEIPYSGGHEHVSTHDVMERLRLELFIRERNLRAGLL